jgi:hypothetical protein
MPQKLEAFTFIFDADKMRELLDKGNPKKVVCVVSIEEAITQEGKKVGALQIIARGGGSPEIDGTFEITGCPRPPCYPD